VSSSRQPTAAWRGAATGAVVALWLAGCTLQSSQWEIKNQPLSCDDANRRAYRTIEGMRYKVTDFAPAAPGQRGVIKATRIVSQAGGEEPRNVTITIDCKPSGADIDISEEGKWLEQMEIQRAFYQAYVNVVEMTATREQLDQQILAGTAPASQQRRDLKVVVEPRRGQAAKLDFAFDLAAAGVLPVRVDISNLTARTYTLDVSAIRLTRADRERVAAISAADAAARVTDATLGNPPQPLTTQSRDAVAAALAARQFAATEIAPGTQREGYLYFPLADYVNARIVLTDKETGEDEGVRVEF